MKVLVKAMALISIAIAAEASASPVTLGSLALGGSACRLGDTGSIEVQIQGGKLQIPAASLLRKTTAEALKRGSCSFALPVQVEPGYRLILRDSSAVGSANVAKGSQARLDVEIFTAGDRGDRMSALVGSAQERVRQTVDLRSSDVVIATSCSGEAFNLRGNTSVSLQGAGAGRSLAGIHLIEISAEIEKCN